MERKDSNVSVGTPSTIGKSKRVRSIGKAAIKGVPNGKLMSTYKSKEELSQTSPATEPLSLASPSMSFPFSPDLPEGSKAIASTPRSLERNPSPSFFLGTAHSPYSPALPYSLPYSPTPLAHASTPTKSAISTPDNVFPLMTPIGYRASLPEVESSHTESSTGQPGIAEESEMVAEGKVLSQTWTAVNSDVLIEGSFNENLYPKQDNGIKIGCLGKYSIFLHDVKSLEGENWLTDSIVNGMCNFYAGFSTDTAFYGFEVTYLIYNQKPYKRISKGMGDEIFNYKQILLPCNVDNNHWVLYVVRFTFTALTTSIDYYAIDSLRKNHDSVLRRLHHYVAYLFEQKWPDMSKPVVNTHHPTCFHQNNNFDCGVHAISNSRAVMLHTDPNTHLKKCLFPILTRHEILKVLDTSLSELSNHYAIAKD